MPHTLGHKMEQDAQIESKIHELVNEVEKYSQSIESIKQSDTDNQKRNQKWVQELEENRGRPLFYPYVGSGLGRGPYVEVEDGSVKLDLINGIGINIMGHSHPKVMKAAVLGALNDVVVQGNLQPNKQMIRLAQKLVQVASRKSRLTHSWLTTSGSMANENALKMCRQKKNGARKVIAMNAAFAGRTTMMAEITDNDTMRVGLPRYNEVLRLPFYDKHNNKSIEDTVKIFKEHIDKNKEDICAFMFEPMQGEGGYNVAPREYFLPLLDLCKEHQIPVWADEIQTFCRTGEFFAFEKLDFGDYVDVCTVAKTLQSGATLYTEELNPQPGLIAGTFAGSSAALSAGLEVLTILDEENYMGPSGKIQKIHDEFVGMLNDLNASTCKGLLNDAGGLGLMVAVTPLKGAKEDMMNMVKKLYEKGLISFGCGRGPFRIRFLIPAVMTSQDIQVARQIIEKSILELKD